MKTRTFVTIIFITFLVFTVGFGWYVIATPGQTMTVSPQPEPTAGASPTATPAPTLKDTISNTEKTVFDPIVTALSFLAAVLISVLVLVLLRNIWYFSGKSNLVIDTFINATGNDDLTKVLPGLNQLTRTYLEDRLKMVLTYINRYNDQGLERLNDFPPPEPTSNQQLDSLMKSLTDTTPGEMKTGAQLLNLVFA